MNCRPLACVSPRIRPAMNVQRTGIRLKLLFTSMSVALLAGCGTSPVGPSLSHSPADAVMMNVPFKIGNAVVQAEVFQRGRPVPTMINVHDDENTSVAAGKIVIEQTGGRLIELAHGGERLVTFQLNGTRHAFDPNRIFSDAGIRDTLGRSETYSEAAHRAVKRFAAQYLESFGLDREPVIVALHNTVDGTYSVESYRPGAQHATAAAALHVSPNRSRFDFFYVTDRRFFDYLRQRDFNVVLQDNAAVPDDGSLSVYFARQYIPYVNIEAELNHLNAQIEMVRVVREMLDFTGLLDNGAKRGAISAE